MVRRTASSISAVTGLCSWRSQARCPYRRAQTSTASRRSCSCTPRWWVPDQTSGSDLPSSACHISGGRSSMTTDMPTWLTGLLVARRIARSGIESPRNSQTSPVRVRSIASSRPMGVPGMASA